ncbi:3-deoxy-D-manno-octulosonic acid transferase [Rhodobacteraceae bacterium D3-12]|nr:3-deoxy-D-manno-octulosonic acid transferase [Rhodobacteraceae bacterium D3-12]
MTARRSVSLSAYLAFARRKPKLPLELGVSRPDGPVLWVHVTSSTRLSAIMQVAARLRMQVPALSLVLSVPKGISKPEKLDEWVYWQDFPEDSIQSSEAFLAHWKPDVCVWTGGHFMPALIHKAEENGIPLFLVDVDAEGLKEVRQRWLPELTRANLRAFDTVLARTGTAGQMLKRLGVSQEIVEVTGPMQEGGLALSCAENEREEMGQILAGRPVWLAAMVQRSELEAILDCHRKVSRYALRLLLILVPDDETDGEEFLDVLKQRGFNTAVWSEGEVPDEACQVLLGDTWGDLGLWYRLSPVTFMASSLTPGHGGGDPYEPAALGSAVLYGPHVSRYLTTYSRFAKAGAARIVKDADSLSSALQNLLAPDQAAQMASAGWELASEGAEVTDRVVDLLLDTLDALELS